MQQICRFIEILVIVTNMPWFHTAKQALYNYNQRRTGMPSRLICWMDIVLNEDYVTLILAQWIVLVFDLYSSGPEFKPHGEEFFFFLLT